MPPTPSIRKRSPSCAAEPTGNELPVIPGERRPSPSVDVAGNELRDPADWRIAKLAERQRGVVTRLQLRRRGLSDPAIDDRLRRGLLHRLHRGVYLVGHGIPLPGARERAAILAVGGTDAFVSHTSALSVWGVVEADPAQSVHVTVVGRKLRSRRGIVVHRVTRLTGPERCRCGGVPVLCLPRVLLDLAAADHQELERFVADAHAQGKLSPAELRRWVNRYEGYRGVERLRAVVEANATGFTRSEAERRMRRLCQEARLPQPQANARIAGYEVDLLWPQHRLIVEVDGYQFHGHRGAFERDRRKQMALVAAGFTVIRVTWRQLCDDPLIVVGTIARALGRADTRGD